MAVSTVIVDVVGYGIAILFSFYGAWLAMTWLVIESLTAW